MVCFRHPTENAVGICKNCQKGLCATCAVEVENGIACRGACEAQVTRMNFQIERNFQQHQRIGTYYRRIAIWVAGFGLLVLAGSFVLISLFPAHWVSYGLIGLMGVAALTYSAINMAESRKNVKWVAGTSAKVDQDG